MGFYKNWRNSRAHLAIYADWFELSQLVETLHTVKRNYLDCTSDSIAAAYKLIFIEKPHSAPYNIYTRFPEDRYVCDLYGNFEEKFNELRVLCLLVRDTETVETVVRDKFCNLIIELIDDLTWGNLDWFDQKEFEKWGDVKWVEESYDEDEDADESTEGLLSKICTYIRNLFL